MRDYRLVEAHEAVLQVRGDRQKFRPFGLYGGKDGAHARGVINPDSANPKTPPGKFMTTIVQGDVFRAVLAGGGGWGDPLERDPTRVLDDVLNEKVSVKSAREDYGVVLNAKETLVDESATADLRTEMRSHPVST